MKPRHDLIVFDWDGTLMDSVAKIVRCFTAAVEDAGTLPPGEDVTRQVIGLGLSEAVRALLPDANEATRAHVVERYRQHFLHLDQTHMPLFPGVREGLEALVDKGFILAIATGKARRGLDRVLCDTGLAHLFTATRCADEAFSKPHPQMLQDILEVTGIEATQALMVGDTTYDMLMARQAGLRSLAVTYGVHTRERLMEHGPLACLDSFNEVYAWLQQDSDQSSASAAI